jgi:cell wall-associated NlpC family hydrolase
MATASFTEVDPGDIAGCSCTACATGAAPEPRSAPGAHHRRFGRLGATGAAVVAVTGVAGAATLTAAPAASALAAPDHAGWDGHRYWFRLDGRWRWTSHYDVYLKYTRGSSQPSSSGTGTGSLKQGWDGHRYWFKLDGRWRWTSHYDVYLRYTGGGTGHPTPKPMPDPAPTIGAVEAAITFAEAQLGKPYVWGGNGPRGYDCSGLVQQAFFRAGIHLPRVSAEQYRAVRPITAGELRRGDLLFWSTSSRSSGIHHVAIYLGGGRYIEAPRPGKDVRISVLSTGYYPTHFGRVAG